MSQAMAKGAFWSVLDKFGQQGISFIVFIVVARFLGPVEYGLASVCFIYLLLAIILLNGLVDGVVSLQLAEDGVLSTLFWLILSLGALLSALCYFTAPLAAALFDEPRLVPVLELFAVVPLLVAACSVPSILAIRDMDFRLLAIRAVVASLVSGTVGIVLAAKGYGVFAIVWQQIVLFVVMNLGIWLFTRWRPKLQFDTGLIKAAVRPGMHLTRVYALGWFDQQLPRLAVGKVVGVGDLGNFAFVMRIRLALQEIFIASPIVVLFPTLSRIHDDRAEQQRLARNMLVTTCLFLFPVLALLAGTAGVYVPLLFGDKWAGAVTLLQIYLLGAASIPFVFVSREVFRANGRLDDYFRINVAVTAAGIALLPLLWLPDGLLVFAIGIGLLGVASVTFYLGRTRRQLGVDLVAVIPQVARLALAAAAAFWVALEAANLTADGLGPVSRLIVAVGGGGAVYVLAVALLLPVVVRDTWAGTLDLMANLRTRRA